MFKSKVFLTIKIILHTCSEIRYRSKT